MFVESSGNFEKIWPIAKLVGRWVPERGIYKELKSKETLSTGLRKNRQVNTMLRMLESTQ